MRLYYCFWWVGEILYRVCSYFQGIPG